MLESWKVFTKSILSKKKLNSSKQFKDQIKKIRVFIIWYVSLKNDINIWIGLMLCMYIMYNYKQYIFISFLV